MPSIRCARCGYENHLHQRFCGMCGNGLASTAPTRIDPRPPTATETVVEETPAEERPFVTSGGPSFLGLGDSSGSADYLLEDESHHGMARGFVFLVALSLAIWCAAWLVQKRNPGWISAQFAQVKTAVATILGSKPAASPAASATPSEASPPAPAASAPPEPAPSQTESTTPEEPPATEKPASSTTQAAAVEKIPTEDRSDSAAMQDGDADAAEGEKYLYGRGVRQDCGHARSSLMTAADLSNAKAQGMLGTMYATGHCVPRDLPTAYHWFLQAQQKDPKNVRVKQDLRLVWRQMTAAQQSEVGSLRP